MAAYIKRMTISLFSLLSLPQQSHIYAKIIKTSSIAQRCLTNLLKVSSNALTWVKWIQAVCKHKNQEVWDAIRSTDPKREVMHRRCSSALCIFSQRHHQECPYAVGYYYYRHWHKSLGLFYSNNFRCACNTLQKKQQGQHFLGTEMSYNLFILNGLPNLT